MTRKIGNIREGQHRGKKERLEIKRANKAREAVKIAAARAKYRNQVKNRPPMDLSAAPAA